MGSYSAEANPSGELKKSELPKQNFRGKLFPKLGDKVDWEGDLQKSLLKPKLLTRAKLYLFLMF